MPDLYIATNKPQTGDSEKLLLARIAANAIGPDGTIGIGYGANLASAARTAQTAGAIIDVGAVGRQSRGIMIRTDITVASGTGGIQAFIRLGISPAFAANEAAAFWVTAFKVTTGPQILYVYPSSLVLVGASGSADTGYVSAALSRYIQFGCIHGDATSYTYNQDYIFLK